MRLSRSFVLAASLVCASTASAQADGRLKFMSSHPNPSVTAFGYYVGPFTGTLLSDPTRPVIDLYCVDVLNQVSWGQTFDVNFTNLTSNDFSSTRHGNAKKNNYIKAAWLAEKYRGPGIQTSQWGGIQAAIWQLLNPGNPNGGTNVNSNSSEAYWLNQVNSWFGNANNVASFDMSKWTVVTAYGAAGRVQGGGPQEFLTTGVTPEPETWLLMGTGLLMVIGFAVKRGRMV